jgi:lipid-A-disaccharide synthase
MAGADQHPELHVFLVAGEESGDRLGAALIAALRKLTHGRVRFSGIGGALMEAEGVQSLFPLGDLAIIGFAAIPARLPRILRRIREAADAVVAAKPDVLVIIDSPEFTHRVARRVRARAPAIPIVDYVCPSVWAWRPGRARRMRAYVDHVLALLPFEPAALARLDGPPSTYVGHPLIEQGALLRPDAAEARRRLEEPPVLLVLPGSRSGEIRRLAPVFGTALGLLAKRSPIEVIVPAVPRLVPQVSAAVATWPVPARIVTDADQKYAAFRTARAALTKSGTSTLELALAGIPMVAAYKVSLLEELVGRALLTVNTAILANLVLGELVVPEFLQRYCAPEALAAALLPLLSDSAERRRQIEAFNRLDEVMGIGQGAPSRRAAAVVLAHAQCRNHGSRESVASGSV